jgi:hypothetical protein
MSAPTNVERDVAALERLAGELAAQGLHAEVRAPAGRQPSLAVRNPRAAVLTENLYTQAGCYWWSWREKIAGCDEVATAAGLVARVLRAAGE